MTPATALSTRLAPARFGGQADFGLFRLSTGTPLAIDVHSCGAVFALRHGPTLINQVLPGPAEDGLLRVYLREWHSHEVSRCTRVVGAGIRWSSVANAATWAVASTAPANASHRHGLQCTTTLELHPTISAWRWRVRVHNPSSTSRVVDVLLAHDVGLADEAAVRNNEAYTSQYIDLQPFRDERLGWCLLARQNQPTQTGHPWLALACAASADGYATDGTQFFGADHRLTGQPAALHLRHLPSVRLQYEMALVALQSAPRDIAPRETVEISFYALFRANHPDASSAADLPALRALIADSAWVAAHSAGPSSGAAAPFSSLFVDSPWWHGDAPDDAELAAWFPRPHRAVEHGGTGHTLAFFCGADTHVVTRAKEAAVARPHGHVLRSGDATRIDDGHFGITVYAAGIFGAQSYCGNASLARLLSVVRDPLGVLRGAGQRVFVHHGGTWHQLGLPSAFAMTPGDARWIYAIGPERVEVRVWCSPRLPAAFLDLRVVSGTPKRFLVTHQLALGANEFDHGGTTTVADDNWMACTPAPDSATTAFSPELAFAFATADGGPATFGGGERLGTMPGAQAGPYVTIESDETLRFGVIQLGTPNGTAALRPLVSSARREYAAGHLVGEPPPAHIRLHSAGDRGVSHVNEIIPWFNHNAAIHFSAPHGLEQYAGGAWGVRDVCQGSLEWLLATDRLEAARRMLSTVFAHQYLGTEHSTAALNGAWPQWFMLPPYTRVQHPHSHGDVCLWPLKALADYLEATGDFHFAQTPLEYTDPKTLAPSGHAEPLWAHCDRVLDHVTSRFLPGTALVNYGDGDWDDTLQPVDPKLRTRMVSAWTVALAYHAFGQLLDAARQAGEVDRAIRLAHLRQRMSADFQRHLLIDNVVAGFVIAERDGTFRPLLHPRDEVTGIRYRLLPMTRAILAGLFTLDDARRHARLIEEELRYPDGVRLMSEPAPYRGGVATLFRRAEMAANVGREIGLQYVHAHLRYAEALAVLGDGDALWRALRTVNPVGLGELVPNAAPRQSNMYFSSSDADFPDRYAAAARWSELRAGTVNVRGGWRLYSSGPGLFLHTLVARLLGVRRSFETIVFDPVLPRSLDGMCATVPLLGTSWEIGYHIREHGCGPERVVVNGARLPAERQANPYRRGALEVSVAAVQAARRAEHNRIEIHL